MMQAVEIIRIRSMWDMISLFTALISVLLVAFFIWKLQQPKVGLKKDLIKRLATSLAVGLIFGFIFFKAINPDSQLLKISSDSSRSEQTMKTSNSINMSDVKSPDGSLRFYQNDPCE